MKQTCSNQLTDETGHCNREDDY